jgi:RNA polymerase sigma factor (sigma-70 family)
MVVRAPASRRSPEQAEERLLVEAAQKDPTRFAELYESNFDRVYAFIARRVGDRDAAEDLTSEVFHKALANLRRFEWRGAPFAAWLLRIAANAIADRGQRTTRELAMDGPPEVDAEAKVDVDLEEVGCTTTRVGSRLRKRLEGETTTDCRSTVVVAEIGDAGAMRNGDGQTAAYPGIRNSGKTVETLGEVMIHKERPLV